MTSFAILNPRGEIIRTTSHADMARRWLRERRHELDGFKVVKLTTPTLGEAVYTPRKRTP